MTKNKKRKEKKRSGLVSFDLLYYIHDILFIATQALPMPARPDYVSHLGHVDRKVKEMSQAFQIKSALNQEGIAIIRIWTEEACLLQRKCNEKYQGRGCQAKI